MVKEVKASRDAERTRAELLAVATEVFAEAGYSGARVDEIAERTRTTKRMIYYYFGGKEGLYAVIVDREMDYVVRRLVESISSGTPRERVERASLAFLTYVRDHPDGFAVLSQDSPLTSSKGTMSSLLNDMAERVGDVFAATLKEAGYDPRGIVEVMEILKRAAGGSRQPEFLSTHPDPGNRGERLAQLLKERYPGGLPPALNRNEEAYRQRVLDVLAGRGARPVPIGADPMPRRGDDEQPARPQSGRALPPDRL